MRWAVITNWPSEDVWHPPECYPLTYLQVMIQPLQVHLTRRMRLSLVKGWYLTSLQEQEAKYLAAIRKVMDDAGVYYQTAELGKVDVGGGGTIAYILSLYGMEVVDCGVAVLNMHAPWEITSKADIYETKKGYVAFLLGA